MMRIKQFWLLLLSVFLFQTIIAESNLPFEQHVLSADRAFTLEEISVDKNHMIHITWQVAPGYYLYQEKFELTVSPHIHLGTKVIQAAHHKVTSFDKAPILLGKVQLNVPIKEAVPGDFELTVTYQGCAERGFCFPPTQKTITLHSPGIQKSHLPSLTFSEETLNQHLALVILTFLIFGLLLSCTPCILPMVPIVFGLLTQMNPEKRKHPFLIVGIYVLSMACTYAVAGLFSARLGMTLQSLFQTPVALVSMSLLLALLGLSQWGIFRWSAHSLQTGSWILSIEKRLPKNSFGGIVLMGILATLITSPCVTPPLLGALTYVAKTQNTLVGGIALWSMGVGMGIPLLLFAAFGRRLIPTSGPWMEHIAFISGSLLLGLAISLLERVWLGPYTAFLWILLFFLLGLRLIWRKKIHFYNAGAALLCFCYAVGLIYQASQGIYGIISPIEYYTEHHTKERVIFKNARTFQELQGLLEEAKTQHKCALIEFTADWCASCQQIKRFLWSSTEIEAFLSDWVLIRVDITQQTGLQKALMLHYGVFAPPHLIFIDADGNPHPEITLFRWVNAEQFKRRIPEDFYP